MSKTISDFKNLPLNFYQDCLFFEQKSKQTKYLFTRTYVQDPVHHMFTIQDIFVNMLGKQFSVCQVFSIEIFVSANLCSFEMIKVDISLA